MHPLLLAKMTAVLYKKDLLGTSSPEALLNTLWFNNTIIHFGLPGCKERHDMTWGDVKLPKTASGEEYLEYNERQTKHAQGKHQRCAKSNSENVFRTGK